MSEQTPVSLTNITPVLRTTGNNTRLNRALMGFIDANFLTVESISTTLRLGSPLVRVQSPVFGLKDKTIPLVAVSAPGMSERGRVHYGTATRPTIKKDALFTPMVCRWLDDESFTQWPIALVEKLDIIDLKDKFKPKLVARSWTKLDVLGSHQKDAGTKILDDNYWVESLGSFSFLGDLDSEDFSDENQGIFDVIDMPETFTGIKVENLYRGEAPVSWEITEVTKKDVMNGNAVFAFVHKAKYIDSTTTTLQEGNIVCLGAIWPITKILRFTKSRNAFVDFLKTAHQNPGKLFEPEKYKEALKNKLKDFTQFWGGVAEVISIDTIPENFNPKDYDVINTCLANQDYVNNQMYRALDAQSFMKSTPESLKLERQRKSLEHVIEQLTKATQELIQKQEEIKSAEEDLNKSKQVAEDLKKYLQHQLKIIEEMQNLIADQDAVLAPVTETVEELKEVKKEKEEVVSSAEKEYQKKLEIYLNEVSAQKDIFQNMLNSGILIRSIIFEDTRTHEQIDIKNDISSATNEHYRLVKVSFLTTRPFPIHVDRATNPKSAKTVYGGPYEVVISCRSIHDVNMNIRLASLHSVFGYSLSFGDTRVKVHPHTQFSIVNPDIDSMQRFIQEWKYCCLGDAASAMTAGFNKKNVKMIIGTALAWISSAYSADQWGAEWTWFPTKEQVDVEGKWASSMESENQLSDITTSLQALQENIENNHTEQTS